MLRMPRRLLTEPSLSNAETQVELSNDAYDAFINSIRAKGDYAPPWTSLGIFYRSLQHPEYERASKCFQKAFELDGGQEIAARYLAEEFALIHEWSLVEVIARRVVENNTGKAALGGKAASKLAWAYKAIGGSELVSWAELRLFPSLTNTLSHRRTPSTTPKPSSPFNAPSEAPLPILTPGSSSESPTEARASSSQRSKSLPAPSNSILPPGTLNSRSETYSARLASSNPPSRRSGASSPIVLMSSASRSFSPKRRFRLGSRSTEGGSLRAQRSRSWRLSRSRRVLSKEVRPRGSPGRSLVTRSPPSANWSNPPRSISLKRWLGVSLPSLWSSRSIPRSRA